MQVLKSPISVLSYSRQGVWWKNFNIDGRLQGSATILYHSLEQHFDLLVPRQSALAQQVNFRLFEFFIMIIDSYLREQLTTGSRGGVFSCRWVKWKWR